jgi:hypothetical protein
MGSLLCPTCIAGLRWRRVPRIALARPQYSQEFANGRPRAERPSDPYDMHDAAIAANGIRKAGYAPSRIAIDKHCALPPHASRFGSARIERPEDVNCSRLAPRRGFSEDDIVYRYVDDDAVHRQILTSATGRSECSLLLGYCHGVGTLVGPSLDIENPWTGSCWRLSYLGLCCLPWEHAARMVAMHEGKQPRGRKETRVFLAHAAALAHAPACVNLQRALISEKQVTYTLAGMKQRSRRHASPSTPGLVRTLP